MQIEVIVGLMNANNLSLNNLTEPWTKFDDEKNKELLVEIDQFVYYYRP